MNFMANGPNCSKSQRFTVHKMLVIPLKTVRFSFCRKILKAEDLLVASIATVGARHANSDREVSYWQYCIAEVTLHKILPDIRLRNLSLSRRAGGNIPFFLPQYQLSNQTLLLEYLYIPKRGLKLG